MHSLKYYHIEHKEKWKCVPEEQIPENAKYESVLYVKYRQEDVEASGEEQEYWGPFYLDFDSPNLTEALADLREVLAYFKATYHLEAEDYRIYASGGKGFHFELNPNLYMDPKFVKALPLRYKNLAIRLNDSLPTISSLDLAVYSQGKGRQWRRTNVKRENGNYKVWIPEALFNGITADQIKQLVTKPGEYPPKFKKNKKNELLVSWFQSTKKLVDLVKIGKPVPDNVVLETATPICVRKLAENSDIKGNVNSNLLTMQAISYGIAKGWTIDQIVSYNRMFIQTYRSTQYKTPTAFEQHFRGLYDYAKEAPDKFKFGCKMMLSCVDNVDCNSCEIKTGEANASVYEGILIKDGEYYYIGEGLEDAPRRLSNFTIELISETVKMDASYEDKSKFLAKFSSPSCQDEIKEFTDEAFTSRALFAKLCGMRMAYVGTDKDLQMLKLAIMHESDHKKIREISYTGLYWYKDEWHYVTHEGSMSLNNTIDKIKSTTDSSVTTRTKLNFTSTEPPRADQIITFFNTFLDMNANEVIVPLTTWFFSAFFSPHCMTLNEPMPSLFVTGTHGSGKTQTMLQLHRLFAPERPSFPSISSTTAFSMNKFCSSTNLMPLIFDEFKPSANTSKRGEEGQVSQAIRASYNKSFESRGTRSRTIEETPFLAPLAIIGEQQINEGAVQDRIILIHMDKVTHTKRRSEALENMKRLNVEIIGAHFLEFVMRIRPEEFVDKILAYDKDLENKYKQVFENRPRRNIANLITVMDYLQQYVLLYTSDEALVDKMQVAMNSYIKSCTSEANLVYQEMKSMDDIAQSLTIMNDIADLMNITVGDLILMKDRHYLIENGILYLDIMACYNNLSAYIHKNKISVYLTDRVSFASQMSKKSYVTVKIHRSDKIIKGKHRAIIGINTYLASKENIVLDNFME